MHSTYTFPISRIFAASSNRLKLDTNLVLLTLQTIDKSCISLQQLHRWRHYKKKRKTQPWVIQVQSVPWSLAAHSRDLTGYWPAFNAKRLKRVTFRLNFADTVHQLKKKKISSPSQSQRRLLFVVGAFCSIQCNAHAYGTSCSRRPDIHTVHTGSVER